MRVPHMDSGGVINPSYFKINGTEYESVGSTGRVKNQWTTIYGNPGVDLGYYRCDTTFTVKMGYSSDNPGMAELEIYGFYE